MRSKCDMKGKKMGLKLHIFIEETIVKLRGGKERLLGFCILRNGQTKGESEMDVRHKERMEALVEAGLFTENTTYYQNCSDSSQTLLQSCFNVDR